MGHQVWSTTSCMYKLWPLSCSLIIVNYHQLRHLWYAIGLNKAWNAPDDTISAGKVNQRYFPADWHAWDCEESTGDYMYIRSFPTCGATAGRIAGYNSGEAQASEVQAKLMVIVFANQLGVHLGNAINSARTLDLWNWVFNIEQTFGYQSVGPTVTFGVGLRGLSGPKAPIVLGTKMRSLYCFATSMTLWTPSMLTLQRICCRGYTHKGSGQNMKETIVAKARIIR